MESSAKFVGMDVHKESISIAVMNSTGKLVMESIIETKAITILQFIQGLRGDVCVTFEEGTWAAWLYDLLKLALESSGPGCRINGSSSMPQEWQPPKPCSAC
jgi:hypothetical protein